jgi:AraC family transcriptional activator FtrA
MPVDEAARLSRLMDWVRAHPAHPHTPASLAKRAAMSVRTLQRQFQETAGLTPLDWVTRERVAAARELLESSRRPMADIAERTGFGSEESFRRHFRLVTGVSPATYRRQFAVRFVA